MKPSAQEVETPDQQDEMPVQFHQPCRCDRDAAAGGQGRRTVRPGAAGVGGDDNRGKLF